MKRAILLAALVATASVQAEDACVTINKAATVVMTAYQDGVPVIEMLEASGENEILRSMVLEAYSGVRFSSDRAKQETIARFANEWTVACYKQVGT